MYVQTIKPFIVIQNVHNKLGTDVVSFNNFDFCGMRTRAPVKPETTEHT